MKFKKTILARAIALGRSNVPLSQRAELLGVRKSTLNDWINKAKSLDLQLEDIAQMSEADLTEMLFPRSRLPGNFHQPDWTEVVLESKRPKVSKNFLWRRYVSEVPAGSQPMSRNTFLREIKRIEDELTPEMQQIAISNSYVPSEISMIDYSGDPVHYWVDGKKKTAQLFVGIVPATSYTFAYATADQSRESHLQAIKALFKFLGGVTDEIWCDNTKSLVDKADKTDPLINREFVNFCTQYDTVAYAVEPGQPRQKAPVENAVKLMQKFVIPELERRRLHSVDEINEMLPALLDEFNAMPFQEMPNTSRTKRFTSEEKPLLKELPLFEYEPGYCVKSLKVSRQNQVRVLGRRIPVFYGHAGETVRVFANEKTGHVRIVDPTTCEQIGERYIGKDDNNPVLPTTEAEMPEAFKRYVETKDKLLERIKRELGEEAHAVAAAISWQNNSYSMRYLNAMIVESHKFTGEVFSTLCADLRKRTPITFAKFKAAVLALIRQGKTAKKARAEESANTRGADHYKRLVLSRQRQTTRKEK